MIKYVRRNQIDIKKYDDCIKNSLQSRVYAYSWYLDIVADNWDILVLNDYEAVMPVPWRRKYFIKYAYQPYFIQQLGVFSSIELCNNTFLEFIKLLSKNFVKYNICFNAENNININSSLKRVNYILLLNNVYKENSKNFFKGRKHALSVARKNRLLIANEDQIDNLIIIAKKYYSFFPYLEKEYSILCSLVEALKKKNMGFVKVIKTIDNKVLGGAIFFKDKHRVTYLFAVYSSEGKKLQAPSFLLDNIIKEYSNTNLLLDFEGSMIKNIASFFKSFGSKKEIYYQLKKN